MGDLAGPTAAQFPLLYSSDAIAGAGTVSNPKTRVTGWKYVKGCFSLDSGMAAAAGYPRVRQSADGVTWDLEDVIAADGGPANGVQYPFKIEIMHDYVAIELVNGAVAGNCRATAAAVMS